MNQKNQSDTRRSQDSGRGETAQRAARKTVANTLDSTLQRLAGGKRTGLMTHIVIGYPNRERAVQLAGDLEQGGADILELQIPFSDPIADGPTIMEACDAALRAGTTIGSALEDIAAITRAVSVPCVVMSYYNPVFAYGVRRFCAALQSAGVSGIIIPDVPPEEERHERLIEQASAHNIHLIRVVSPASTPQRLSANSACASGFLYTTSRFGVTGVTAELDPRLVGYLKTLRSYFTIPVAVGFGISKPEHVAAIRGHADIVIVGSAIVELLKRNTARGELVEFVERIMGQP